MSDILPLPPTESSSVHYYLTVIAKAMDEGGTNPHLTLRKILGSVYAQGHHDGYVASLHDRPLTAAPDSEGGAT